MKMMRRVSSLVLALAFILSLSVTAFAADTSITYEGKKNNKGIFTYKADDTFAYFTKTDLFDNFKNVMPGDELTQKITIANEASGCDYIEVYMHAVPHGASNDPLTPVSSGESNEFLSKLTMQVENGSKEIYDSTPDQPAQLTEKVLLGKFEKGESTTITVSLQIPVDLKNDFQNRIGEVDWVFTVEEHNRPNTPKTGDDTTIMPYVIMLTVGLAGMTFLLISKRRKNQA